MKQIAGYLVTSYLLIMLQAGCAPTETTQSSKGESYHTQFTEYLNSVVTNYIELKNALVNDNPSQVSKEASEFLTYLREIDDSSLDAEVKQQWVEQKLELMSMLEQLTDAMDVKAQRRTFSVLSSRMESLIDQYGPVEQTLYRQYCPEALEGEGASWLNEKKEILNPYGSDSTLHCGKVVEVLEGKGD